MSHFAFVVKSFLITLVMLSAFVLSGCDFKEKMTRWIEAETYNFNGVYSNQHNSDQMTFKDAMVSIKANGGEMVVPFSVKDSFLHIKLRQSSREKRPDIVMRIHGKGEVLTCSACAKFQLSNIWIREDW